MKVKFNIHYHTQWGQSVCLLMYETAHKYVAHNMQHEGGDVWSLETDIAPSKAIRYSYAIRQQNEQIDSEWGETRIVKLPKTSKQLHISDSWRTTTGESPFRTSIFSECFFRRSPAKKIAQSGDLMLSIHFAQVKPGQHIAISGNQDALGNWNPSKKIRLNESKFPYWSVALQTSQINFPLEYKYLLVDSMTDEVILWEDGSNRCLNAVAPNTNTIVHDEHFKSTSLLWKAAGVAIPVFSLRSNDSFGTGEFQDLKKMVDWAKATGQQFIQTLPVNDTTLDHTNKDSYPYNAVSVYALHPAYLHLNSLGKLKSKKLRDYFASKQKDLNALSFVDYQNVMTLKWEFVRAIYAQEGTTLFDSDAYKVFFKNNKEWLVPYAVFSYLRDLNGTPDFNKWPAYRLYKKAEIESLTEPQQAHHDKIAIHYFVQYHLHKQLKEVHEYARAAGIAIKGDIPIGVSPHSVDAWVTPDLFNTSLQAGAPPDDFSETGQNWGFPTYNWDKMEKDGYRWWKKRFEKMASYFDAYRIDHILGFFRIWGIPSDAVLGLTGSFQPALPFTRQELEARGLQWNENRFLKPFLNTELIRETFAENASTVLATFFDLCETNSYQFKPEFDTQKKIEKYFNSDLQTHDPDSLSIRNALYMLHCEVIFVRDIQHPEKFHPRIGLHNTTSFALLPEATQYLLNQIHADYFYHRHNEFWKQQAYKKLPALIGATNMLVCGEDLGMVPDSVPEVMQNLEILSLEIQRMPKQLNTEFAMPTDAPYLSVCTTSTHDMNPVRAWWEEDVSTTQRFYNLALGLHGVAPKTCEPWIVERIIDQHLHSRAMLVLLPWQDWIGMDADLCLADPSAERINKPDDPNNFWCYRMHITLEQLLLEDSFNQKIKTMIEKSDR